MHRVTQSSSVSSICSSDDETGWKAEAPPPNQLAAQLTNELNKLAHRRASTPTTVPNTPSQPQDPVVATKTAAPVPDPAAAPTTAILAPVTTVARLQTRSQETNVQQKPVSSPPRQSVHRPPPASPGDENDPNERGLIRFDPSMSAQSPSQEGPSQELVLHQSYVGSEFRHQLAWMEVMNKSVMAVVPAHMVTLDLSRRTYSDEEILFLNEQVREVDLRVVSPIIAEVRGWDFETLKRWIMTSHGALAEWYIDAKGPTPSANASTIPRFTDLWCISGVRRVLAVRKGMDPKDAKNEGKNWLLARLVPEGQ
jgi:hypothetical protein